MSDDQQAKEVARRILGLHQRTNRADLLRYIKSLPKSVGIDWESVGDDTFLIVPGFVSVNAAGEPSELPVPLRVVLDDTDAPIAMLRMWAARVIGDDHEGPADNNCGLGAEKATGDTMSPLETDRETITTGDAVKALRISRTTFQKWVANSSCKRIRRGVYYKDEIQKLAHSNGHTL